MYNEERKLAFIRDAIDQEDYSSVSFARATMNAIQKHEEFFGKDVCLWGEEEWDKARDVFWGRTKVSIGNRWTVIRKYVRWCQHNKIPINRFALQSGVSSLFNPCGIEHILVGSPTHLQAFLDMVFENEDTNTSDNVLRAYCWMLYAGIKNEDTIKIMRRNVQLDIMAFVFNGREYHIYKEGILSIKKCLELDAFNTKHFLYTLAVKEPRIVSEQLLRGQKTEATTRTLKRRLSDAVLNSPEFSRVSPKRIYDSGYFYRAYMLEKNGLPFDAEYLFENGVGTRIDSDKPLCKDENDRRRVINRIKENYGFWKETFYSEENKELNAGTAKQ